MLLCLSWLLSATALADVTIQLDAPDPVPAAGLVIGLVGDSAGTLSLTVVNGSADVVELDWSASAFIDANGQPSRLVPPETLLVDATRELPPAVLPTGTRWQGKVSTSSLISWEGTTWQLAPFYTTENVGQHLAVDLALRIGEATHRYRQGFTVVTLEAAAAAGVDLSAECERIGRGERRARTWAWIAGGSLGGLGGIGVLSTTASIGDSTPEDLAYGYLGAGLVVASGAATATPFALYARARHREGERLGCWE